MLAIFTYYTSHTIRQTQDRSWTSCRVQFRSTMRNKDNCTKIIPKIIPKMHRNIPEWVWCINARGLEILQAWFRRLPNRILRRRTRRTSIESGQHKITLLPEFLQPTRNSLGKLSTARRLQSLYTSDSVITYVLCSPKSLARICYCFFNWLLV